MPAATEFAPGLTIQHITAPQKLSDYKLIAFDMDSTLITIECVDEIADATGKKAEVAAITEATMRGEITDFKDSLRQRVGKLVGVTEADMARVLTERLRLTPGADTLVRAAQAAGLKVLLVSGGFTYFAEHVRGLLGIDFVRANVLEVRSGPNCGELTGHMVDSPGGTSAMAPRSAEPCWKWHRCWVSSLRSASPWAMAPTTCHDGRGRPLGGLSRQAQGACPGHGGHQRRWAGSPAGSAALSFHQAPASGKAPDDGHRNLP